MSAGNHLNGGRVPAPICAYLRYLAEWCPNRISLNTPGVYQADYGAYNTVLVYETTRPAEFFLLENRDKFDLDQHLPANGLAIYHCDTEGSNERQGGTAKLHYQCSLLQADGRLDLEHNANQGDPNDFFRLIPGEALSDATNPSTKMWDGSDSGLRIADITTTGKTITFRVPPRRSIMSTTAPSTDTDPLALQRLQEQTKILQANLDFYKLTVQTDQEKLKAEIDRVKLEADKQKAEADKIKALLPTGTTKPLSGETKTDEKFGYLAKLAVNEAVNVAAAEIAKHVRGAIGSETPARIVLVDTLDFSGDDIQALQIPRQMDALRDAMADQATKIEMMLPFIEPEAQTGKEVLVAGAALPALSQLLAGVPGMLSWAADIAAYFQVEDTYKSVDVTVPLTALQTCVADALKATPLGDKQKPSSSGPVCFPDFHTFGTLAGLPILDKFRECSEGAARAQRTGGAA